MKCSYFTFDLLEAVRMDSRLLDSFDSSEGPELTGIDTQQDLSVGTSSESAKDVER